MSGEQINDYDGSVSSPVYDTSEKDFLRDLIDVDDVLENFEHRVLRGEIKQQDPHTGQVKWIPMPGDKIVNEIGIREIMSRIIGKVSKVARLTYKTDEEIMKDLFYFDMSITELIAKRSDAWDMAIEVAKSIKDSAVELVWDISAASRDGFFAINLRTSYSRSDVSRTDTTASQSAGKRSFLGIPLPSKK